MKKNAFTLIELIAVIVILSIVLTLSVPSLIGALKNNKEKSLEKINELIILAAKDYVVDYGLEIPRKITQNELCKNYLDCPIINPVTKDEMIFSVIVDENKNYTIDKNELIELKVVLNGGKLSKDISGGYTPNTEIILETPTRERHGFAGWEVVSGDAVIEGSVLKLGTKNSTIVANWVGNPVKLNVDLDGGVSSINYNSEYYTRNTLDLGTPTKANNMFVGWKLVSGDAVLSGNKLTFGYEDVSVKATWLKVVEEFAYTGSQQTYEILVSGYYKLEVWGAQGGGSNGGLGGYSTGTMFFKKGQKIYLNVGGTTSSGTGGYNGGGNVTGNVYGGGGATHIATSSGLLSSLAANQSSILIVASGGGGSGNGYAGGSGGGIAGVAGVGDDHGAAGSQSNGGAGGSSGGGSGSFGQGGSGSWSNEALGGGGAGFYGGGSGGGAANNGSGGGGSGYIGNDLLTDKAMYCYNCTTSTATSTLTYSTTNSSSTPTSKYAKQGGGYAKVSLLETSESDNRIIKNKEFDAINKTEIFIAPLDGKYKLEVWGAQGGGSNGGYGAYAVGTISLIKNQKLYITVSEKPSSGIGGYNGGGTATGTVYGGGGATHIATVSGLLSSLSSNQTSILIVAAGGGGSGNGYAGGAGGGISGVAGSGDDPGKAGTHTGGGAGGSLGGGAGSFGKGGTGSWEGEALGGGGAGFYGGGSGGGTANNGSGGGGSSYIGNSLLTNKVMYCYNCTASSDTATKTISTTCTKSSPTENCSKQGNGYAKVTYIGE